MLDAEVFSTCVAFALRTYALANFVGFGRSDADTMAMEPVLTPITANVELSRVVQIAADAVQRILLIVLPLGRAVRD